MKFRQLDSTGDWTFGAGLSNYASGQQAIMLNIKTSILMWQGDCFFSLSGWVNWKNLSATTGQQKNLNIALQTLIAQCYGVMNIVTANVAIDNVSRRASATYSVDTVYTQSVIDQTQILSGGPTN